MSILSNSQNVSLKRGFVAIDFPPLNLSLKDEVKCPISFINPFLLHLTLKFLGNYDLKKAEKINELCGFGFFKVELKGLGVFPNEKNPRVLWVGVHGEKLEKLAREVHRLLGKDRFKGHITLARLKGHCDLTDLLKKYKDTSFGSFTIDKIKLKESILTSTGHIHKTLLEVKL